MMACYFRRILFILSTIFSLSSELFIYGLAEDNYFSKSLSNFIRIRNELQNQNNAVITKEKTKTGDADKRADVTHPEHENWHGQMFAHLKLHDIPDFGHNEIHSMDEKGESFHLDSTPRHHVHHGHFHHNPHFLHEIYTHHREGEHPIEHHEHSTYHEPVHNHIPMMHHANHHSDHQSDDEESGDHEEHHEDESMHGDSDDWDVGGGYFQLEEHGSDVNVVALKKHGTKVHMGGGDFNVIRDPWRHHSLFAGLFHPHEMPGHGNLPMEQFHQHFTYIANDRAINHHVYEHHTHNERDHIHEHDPGHEHDYFYHHPPEPNNDGGKRGLSALSGLTGSTKVTGPTGPTGHADSGKYELPVQMDNGKRGDLDAGLDSSGEVPSNSTITGQAKQYIAGSNDNNQEIITIPLKYFRASHKVVPATRNDLTGAEHNAISPQTDKPRERDDVFAQNQQFLYDRNADKKNIWPDTSFEKTENGEIRSKDSKEDGAMKLEKEHPKVKTPRLSPFNGNKMGPNLIGDTNEMPFMPIFKRQLGVAESRIEFASSKAGNEDVRLPRRVKGDRGRVSRLRKAFLGKLLMTENAPKVAKSIFP